MLRVSFGRVLRVMTAMRLAVDLGDGVLTESQIKRILHPPPTRRAGSCPRAVRQPVTGWPHLLKPDPIEEPLEFTVV